ncbi:hypothetical protein [Neptunicella sp. SCSIO 80796]|uniref:hypothetical protein n=1 Tax=Neptunicella plasticusilytica TaxID=3117012 RepID=UPI003A4DA7C7
MNKSLIIFCLPLLLFITIISVLTNYQSGQYNAEERKEASSTIREQINVNWKTVLAVLPQYKSKQAEISTVVPSKEVHISDSTIIAIVADTPRSILLVAPEQQAPIQLTEDEGWLANWKINTILPDSVIWINTDNQQTYEQSLFRNSQNDDENSTSSKSGK